MEQGILIKRKILEHHYPCAPLEENMEVLGWVNLFNSSLQELPSGLVIHKWLDLRGSIIKSLPNDLVVGSWLNVSFSGVTSLPEGLSIGEHVYTDKQLIVPPKLQLDLITKSRKAIEGIRNPTKDAYRLHQLLWKL